MNLLTALLTTTWSWLKLGEISYTCTVRVMQSNAYGSASRRVRAYILAFAAELGTPEDRIAVAGRAFDVMKSLEIGLPCRDKPMMLNNTDPYVLSRLASLQKDKRDKDQEQDNLKQIDFPFLHFYFQKTKHAFQIVRSIARFSCLLYVFYIDVTCLPFLI